MTCATKPILLVGATPGDNAEQVFRTLGPAIGDQALGLTDGETGMRRMWVLYIAWNVWRVHPDITMVKPIERGVPGMPEYVPADYKDLPLFGIRDGVDEIHVETLGYPDEAKASYALFCKLRDEGVIPQGTRFQFCFPFVEDAVRPFGNTPREMAIMVAAYADVLKRDVTKIVKTIPPEDLVIQWDINIETMAIARNDHMPEYPRDIEFEGDPMERFLAYISDMNTIVPDETQLGLHLCYGDLGHKHMVDPTDLGLTVNMANKAREISPRSIDFVHMPVPSDRTDDAYFQPLSDLDMGDATLYIGLIHYTDGVDGARKRIELCKRYYDGPTGVATECGMGRRPPDQDFNVLLDIHRQAIDFL